MAADRTERVRLLGWSLLALVVALVRDRAWATPNLAFFSEISKHLSSNPFPKGLDGDYLLTNLSGPTLARVLGQTEPHEYARLHLLVLVVGLGLGVAAMYRRFGYRAARVFVFVLALSPAVTVCLEWLGQPDALTLPLALAVTLAPRRWVAFAFAVALGLTHPEQGLVVAAVATAVFPFCRATAADVGDDTPTEPWWRRGIVLVGGVAVGRAITEVYLRVNDIVVTRPRTSYLDLGLDGFVDHHLTSSVALLYSLWGPLWLALGYLGWRWWRTRETGVPLVAAVALAALVPVAVTLDETRVYSLTTAPLLVAISVLLARAFATSVVEERTRRRVVVESVAVVSVVVVSAAVPGMFSAGDDYWSPALHPAEFAEFLVDGSVPGGPERLTPWLLEPFGFDVPTAG